MSSLLKDDPSSRIMYDKIKVDTELNYEKLAEDSFKADVKTEESLIYSSTNVTSASSSVSAVVSAAGVVVASPSILSSTHSQPSTTLNSIVQKSVTQSSTTASIMSQHGNKRLFKCGFCSSTFADTYKLERHVKSEHRDITDRAKYETFPWQEPGGSSKSSHRSRQNNAPKTLFVDPSQTFNMGHKQPNIISKLKIEPIAPPQQQVPQQAVTLASTSDVQQNVISSEYFLCQVCSKIFVSYKDFTLHMNESPACKNGGTDDAFTSNDVLVILSPEDSLKFAGETILDTVVEATPQNEVITHQTTPTAVYECHLCRALFASADYLKKTSRNMSNFKS
ncbi:unnamed protein product [Lepeophtheirus salmonis]|uniref:(salmon louse) hypothetical protein n=1 Tax=Lepeophtheirus salmonis TaxID=72036 RepID=A0A7R8HCV6_LEPSM|nr:unnamed protein product [Lepeophtheirus salmonis]CAF3014311.1 unnamed protein product [Lepeophtheirus salmonis]